jgi:diaminopimelate epimerase
MLEFSKFEALGNDFMIVDARTTPFDCTRYLAARLGDRRRGVGFDQLLILRQAGDGALRAEIRNQDGSPAEQCGNGMRALALYLSEDDPNAARGRILTDAGPVDYSCRDADRIQVTLPPPVFQGELESSATPGPDGPAPDRVSIGNPHVVIELQQRADAELLRRLGEHFNQHHALPEGANVNLVRVLGTDQAELQVYERGVGPTLACGSGACATAVSLIRRSRVGDTVAIDQPGGRLVIHWPGGEQAIVMTGAARRVFEGSIDLESLEDRASSLHPESTP